MESIAELRKICQETRDDVLYQSNWFDRNAKRRISIYITKPLLLLGLSANQATLVDLLIGLAAGAFLTSANPRHWLIGIALFYLFFVFDCVDGEIARYRKSSSAEGSYLDGGLGILMWPYILACMTFGIQSALQSNIVFAVGFLAAIGWPLYGVSALLPYPILHSLGRLQDVVEASDSITEATAMRWGRTIFGMRGFIPALVTVTLVDYLTDPFAVAGFVLNARFVYLALFAGATLAGIVLRTWNVTRHGVKLVKP